MGRPWASPSVHSYMTAQRHETFLDSNTNVRGVHAWLEIEFVDDSLTQMFVRHSLTCIDPEARTSPGQKTVSLFARGCD